MKLNPDPASGFILADMTSYDFLASEYYDEIRHPTCADFRSAARAYLSDFFKNAVDGRIAEIGCGQSLLTEFRDSNLVLIDSSSSMLSLNSQRFQQRLIDVERHSFGISEFDWIFGILSDPYNTPTTWLHICEALKPGAECIFIVPSYTWAKNFRSTSPQEKENLAAFATADGRTVYVPSIILPEGEQLQLIKSAGLSCTMVGHVQLSTLTSVKSRKISDVLAGDDPVLDCYHAAKPAASRTSPVRP